MPLVGENKNLFKFHWVNILNVLICGGSKAWSNAQDLRSCPLVGSPVRIRFPALTINFLYRGGITTKDCKYTMKKALSNNNFERILIKKGNKEVLEHTLNREYTLLEKLKNKKIDCGPFINDHAQVEGMYEKMRPFIHSTTGYALTQKPSLCLRKNLGKNEGLYSVVLEGHAKKGEIQIRMRRGPKVEMTLVHEMMHHAVYEKFPYIWKGTGYDDNYDCFDEGLAVMMEKEIASLLQEKEGTDAYLFYALQYNSVRELGNALAYHCYKNGTPFPPWAKKIKRHNKYADEFIRYSRMKVYFDDYVVGNGVFSILRESYGPNIYKSLFKGDVSHFLGE